MEKTRTQASLIKAAEMALKALVSFSTGTNKMFDGEFAEEIKALRQALAHPEYQTVSAPQPQTFTGQKPVVWLVQHKDRHDFVWGEKPKFLSDKVLGIEPLYTAPPKREWIGLEDEDVATVKNEFNRGALWAEQILKEKNT